MAQTRRTAPKISAETFTIIRASDGATISERDVRRTRWSLIPGGEVVVRLYCRDFSVGAAQAVGRVLVDAGVASVRVQAEMDGERVREFLAAMDFGARCYVNDLAGAR